ncbi:hypothetical protein WICMUC_004465 [Wickerhamomyces mucosus]|uniref:Methyltransferase type 11 domain-containing protein n=1 Tax=Wickerhamomyces mucosus TaxID=1378264 RepID=A0A9P8TAX0_9ASCO|nr:hypothetical protein WICMUC_004465 [Wickerhamomyces mucosus]
MATYAQKDFDSDNYQDKRPGYPPSLFKAISDYHKGDRKVALDVGSGPGTASFPLLEYFDKVIATDPSDIMIKPGIEAITPDLKDRISFHVSSGEEFKNIEDGSVDLITCAEALHWINHENFFKEASRVLKPNGTIAFWGYIEPIFIDHPKSNDIYEKYVFEDDRYMGPLWKPGKHYLRYFFNDVKIPAEEFKDVEKHDYYPGKTQKKTAYFLGDENYSMKKFADYLSSWSAVHDWKRANPDAEFDVSQQLINELKETFKWDDDTKIRAEWGTTYTFIRKN